MKAWRALAVVRPILPRTHPLALPLWRYPKRNWPGRLRLEARLQTRWLMDLWAVFTVYAVLGTAQVNFRWPFVWEGVGVFLAFGGAGLLSSARSSRRARSDEPRTRAWRQLPLQLAEQELQEHEPGRPY